MFLCKESLGNILSLYYNFGSMSDVVECTDVVCSPKRTLAEQAEKGRVLPSVDFFRLSEARLRSLTVFERTSARTLAERGACVECATVRHIYHRA